MSKLTTRMQMAMERAWTDREGVVRVDNSTPMRTIRGLQARRLVEQYSHILTSEGLAWRDAASKAAEPSEQTREEVSTGSRSAVRQGNPAKRVQHDEVKPGMTIKLKGYGPAGRWVTIEHIYGFKLSTLAQEASAEVRAYYTNAQEKKRFTLSLYLLEEGYLLHPASEMLAAKNVQGAGRADVRNVILREYSIKLCIVDRVDNQGQGCGYCCTKDITCNIYATVPTDEGRTEESAWSTCDDCILPSMQVEDVDPSHAITIERAKS